MSTLKPIQVKYLFVYILKKVQDVLVSTKESHLKKKKKNTVTVKLDYICLNSL